MATLNCGSMNFGDEIFENPFPLMREMARRIGARGIVPELEIYDAGMIDNAMLLVNEGLLTMPAQFDFVLGVRGGLSASVENLEFLVKKLPHPQCTWTAAGIGRWQLPLAQMAIERGGNVRVGIEDNIYLSKGVLAKGSYELVSAAVKLIEASGKRAATPSEARDIFFKVKS
jgi:3-keto-5-aminohexanoate cleavage enzyme